jgi:hypothetical protein
MSVCSSEDGMTEENDVLGKHAERRRAFLARTATTSPVVGLLLAQSARPARAATYGGGEGSTTIFETPTFPDTTDFTFTLPETTTSFPQTTLVTVPISTTFAQTTIVTVPITTFPSTTVVAVPITTTFARTTIFTTTAR